MRIKIIRTLCVLSFTVLLTSCKGFSGNTVKEVKADAFKDIHLGVIQTTQNANLSYISFYDTALNYLGEKKIKYGDIGDDTRLPIVDGDSMYTVPLGLGNQKELKIALQFDRKTWQYKTLSIQQQGTLMFCVDSKNIYTTNNFNNQGFITQCSIATGALEKWQAAGVIMTGLSCYDGVLYAWGTQPENNADQPYLFIFKTNPLKLIQKLSITGSGSCQYASCKKGDNIYFSNNYTAFQEEEGNILSKYNLKTNKIENITLKDRAPYQIFEYKEKLYITHCNPMFHRGNKITVYDLKTGSQKLVTMENVLVQSAPHGEYLYSRDDKSLYVYDINTLKLIKKKDIYIPRQEANMNFRIVGFFIND